MDVNVSNGLIVQSRAYIASSTGVMLDTEWQGFRKGIFGSGLFMLKANGEGDYLSMHGGIIQKDLKDNEKMILDNHHFLALSENSNYRVMKFGGMKTTILRRRACY
jgi:uncharacterized protein (AIM24 family)